MDRIYKINKLNPRINHVNPVYSMKNRLPARKTTQRGACILDSDPGKTPSASSMGARPAAMTSTAAPINVQRDLSMTAAFYAVLH